MKNRKALSLFLCIGIACSPLHASANEGFSWKIISDESSEENIEDSPEKQESKEADKEQEPEDASAAEEEKEASDEEKDDSEEEIEGKKDDEEDDEDDEEEDDDEESRSKYPSKNIYSKLEMEEMIEKKYKELKKAYEIKDKFQKTKEIDRIDSFILNFCGDPLKNKKIAFLGDSITAGNGGTLTPDGGGLDYTDFIAKYTNAEIVNLGIGGTPFDGNENDDALVYRYKDIPGDSDIIVLFGGINDLFAGSEHFGSLDEPEKGTYCGDINETFKQIGSRYPDAEVYVVITYPNKMEDYKEYTNEDWQVYADVQIELADQYDFHVIDLYREGFLDSKDSKIRNAFFKDDIHPDDLGSEILGRHILVHLIEDYL